MKKRILSASLAALIGLSSVVPAFAAVTPADGLLDATGEYANSTGSVVADKDAVDINGVVGKDTTQGKYSQYDTVVDGYTGTTMDETKSEVNVYATVAPSYSIKIPKTIILSSSGLGLYDIGVKGDMTGAQTLTIRPDDKITDTPETDFYMSEQNAFVGKKDDIVAVVEQSKTKWTWSDINKVDYTWLAEAGKITAENISAGSWAGTFDFVIGMDIENAAANEDAEIITNYTTEEIEADATMFGIGKTQSDYVIADFNDDYTEVIITKNGDNSDGIMMDWADEELTDIQNSPMVNNLATLKTVKIENGITSIGNAAFAMCENIKEVYLPKTLISIGVAAFGACTSIENISIPNSILNIGIGAFTQCSSLKEVNIKNNAAIIGDKAFYECESITDVYIIASSLGEEVFYDCYNIKNVTLGGIDTIKTNTFRCVDVIENIVILDDVKSIEEDAFYSRGWAPKIGLTPLHVTIYNPLIKFPELNENCPFHFYSESQPYMYEYRPVIIHAESGSTVENWINEEKPWEYTFVAI